MINSSTSASLMGGGTAGATSGTDTSILGLIKSLSQIQLTTKGAIIMIVILLLCYLLFFDPRRRLPNLIMGWLGGKGNSARTFDAVKGAGSLGWLAFVPSILIGSIIVIFAWFFDYSVTNTIGIVAGIIVASAVIFSHPSIDPVWAYPKAYFNPSFEGFLRAIAADMGMPNVEFRVDALEGFNAYAYIGWYRGRRLEYVMFGKQLLDFVQEFDTPERPDLQRRSILAYVLAHEISHVHGDDTLTKHNSLRFIMPLAKACESLGAMRGSLISSLTPEEGKTSVKKSIFKGLLAILIFPFEAVLAIFFHIVFSPFAFLSRKMEFRADKKAYEYVTSSAILRDQGINAKEGIRFFLRHILESGMVPLRPSMFTSAMSSHPHPVERGNAVGVDILSNWTERSKS